MQYHWLNRQNNDRLIIFFAGWSFDYKPFEFLECGDFDVLFLYDYNSEELPEIPNYNKNYLIAWSMGVYSAYRLRNVLPNFIKKIAVNGTAYPVDDYFGIPQKPFLLTLKHAKIGLEGKFYQNIFDNTKDYERYVKFPVERPIENRVDELNTLYKRITENPESYTDYYDFAIVGLNDKIIPPKNQLNFWKDKAKTLNSGHFPFYNYKSWTELLCK